jgi:AraC-like DNA-binding protein
MAFWIPKGTSVNASSASGADFVVVELPWTLTDVDQPFGHESSPLLCQMMRYLWLAESDAHASMPVHPVIEALDKLLPVWTNGAHALGLPLPSDPSLREALQWMHDRLEQPVGPVAGAAQVGLSVRSFQRRCQKELGMTPITWLQRARIMRSCELLMNLNHSVAKVAVACGYRSQASFGRVFKTHMGVTPAIWRHQG